MGNRGRRTENDGPGQGLLQPTERVGGLPPGLQRRYVNVDRPVPDAGQAGFTLLLKTLTLVPVVALWAAVIAAVALREIPVPMYMPKQNVIRETGSSHEYRSPG